MMEAALPRINVDALAIWARDGKLRAKADSVRMYEDDGYFDCPDKGGASDVRWWKYFWVAVNDDEMSKKCTVNWTAGELTAHEKLADGTYTSFNVRGLQFNRNDLIRCIRAASGKKDPVNKICKTDFEKWAKSYVATRGLEECTSREIVSAAKLQFPGIRGVTVAARTYLTALRSGSSK